MGMGLNGTDRALWSREHFRPENSYSKGQYTYRVAEGSGQERSYQLFSISGILGTSCLEFHVILAATL